jgi:hypothetical protein
MSGPLRNWIKVRFITGFFVTVPAIATAWLLYVFWDTIDTFFSPGYEQIFGRRIPGLGFLTAIAVMLVMGTIATTAAGMWIKTLLSGPPASSRHTLTLGSSDKREATTLPAEPAPITM